MLLSYVNLVKLENGEEQKVRGSWDSNDSYWLCPGSLPRLLLYDPSTQQIHVMQDITWLNCMYYTKLDVDNSIEFVVTPIQLLVSDNWEGEQSKLLPDANTDDESLQEGNADGVPDDDKV